MFLTRKISLAKWNAEPELAKENIAADAVTIDLRTYDNSLSFWRCDAGTSGDVEEAVIAMVAAGDQLDKVDVVWLSDEELQADGLILKDTEGNTPVADLADRHVDVCGLDYGRIGTIAVHVVAAINSKRFRRLTKANVKKLLLTALQQGRFSLNDISPKLRQRIAG